MSGASEPACAVGAAGQVPVGAQRQRLDAPPRSPVLRCQRPDGDLCSLREAPDPKAKPIVR